MQSKLKGHLRLATATVEDDPAKMLVFSISNSQTHLVVQCKSPFEKNDWIAALIDAIELAKDQRGKQMEVKRLQQKRRTKNEVAESFHVNTQEKLAELHQNMENILQQAEVPLDAQRAEMAEKREEALEMLKSLALQNSEKGTPSTFKPRALQSRRREKPGSIVEPGTPVSAMETPTSMSGRSRFSLSLERNSLCCCNQTSTPDSCPIHPFGPEPPSV